MHAAPVDEPAFDPMRRWSQPDPRRKAYVAGHWGMDPFHADKHAWIYGAWQSKEEGWTEIEDTVEWSGSGWMIRSHEAERTRPGYRYEPGSWDCRDGEHTWTPGRWYRATEPREPRHEVPALVRPVARGSGRTDIHVDPFVSNVSSMVRVGRWVSWRSDTRTWRVAADGTGCVEELVDGFAAPRRGDPKDTWKDWKPPPVIKLASVDDQLYGLSATSVIAYASDGHVTSRPVTGQPDDPFAIVGTGRYLYVQDWREDVIRRVPVEGGAAEVFADLGHGAGEGGLTLVLHGANLYAATYGGSVFEIPLDGGKVRTVAQLDHIRGLEVDDHDLFVFAGVRGKLVRIDLATGARAVLLEHFWSSGYLAQAGDWIYLSGLGEGEKSTVIRVGKHTKAVETLATNVGHPREIQVDERTLLVNMTGGIVRLELR